MSRSSRFGTAIAAAVVCLLAGCSAGSTSSGSPSPTPTSTSVVKPNPLANNQLFVDPQSHAALQVASWTQAGNTAQAQAIAPLASNPAATWLTGTDTENYQLANRISAAARANNTLAEFVMYDLPGRDCGQFSNGGAQDQADYLAKVGASAAGIGQAKAVVILEPDAVPFLASGGECVADPRRANWPQMLGQAIDILHQQPHTSVYLDAGNATWFSDLSPVAHALQRAGIARAEGFAVNTSNFVPTSQSVDYGHQLGQLLPVANFVVDTSRNGNPAPLRPGPGPVWCNPPERRLGNTPTTATGIPAVDAFLWVKVPGDSDGTCNGGPPAGTWWPEAALDLVR